jgi:PKD repeat protein
MTISSANYTVTTTASVVVANDQAAEEVHFHSSSGTLYIGGADVTVANGYKMDNGDKTIVQNHGNPIYAITSAGTATLSTLVIQK